MVIYTGDISEDMKTVLKDKSITLKTRKRLRESALKYEVGRLEERQRALKYSALAVEISLASEQCDYPLPIAKMEGKLFKKKLVFYCPVCMRRIVETDRAAYVTDGCIYEEYAYYLCQCGYEYAKCIASS